MPNPRRLSLVLIVLITVSALMTVSAEAKGFRLLYTFSGSTDGSGPTYMVQASDGNFYGTTYSGGAYGYGTVFKIDNKGKEAVLYSFQGSADGSAPQGVVMDSIGNLWGTTQNGGTYGFGTLFKIAPDGHAVWHSFQGYPGDGAGPVGPPILDQNGNLYGITMQGGNGSCQIGSWQGCGVVYALDTFSGYVGIVHNFQGWPTDGAIPAALILGSKGGFFGTTSLGGTTNCTNNTPGCGIVFKISSTGKEVILHSFTGASHDGDSPTGLLVDAQGNIYGTTVQGGTWGGGEVYELPSHGKITKLYSFKGGSSGQNPIGSLVRDNIGNTYGTTEYGPTHGCSGSGCGTIFKVSPKGKHNLLFAFPDGAQDGVVPTTGLMRTSSGVLYGVTQFGGAGYGVAYEFVP
jgi:uncharacterized repeat protein (TIGR03803 family)